MYFTVWNGSSDGLWLWFLDNFVSLKLEWAGSVSNLTTFGLCKYLYWADIFSNTKGSHYYSVAFLVVACFVRRVLNWIEDYRKFAGLTFPVMSVYFYYNQQMHNQYHNIVFLYNPHSCMFPHFHVTIRQFHMCALLSCINPQIAAVKITVS